MLAFIAVTHESIVLFLFLCYYKNNQPKTKEKYMGFEDFEIKNGVLEKYRGNGSNVVIPNSVISIGEG